MKNNKGKMMDKNISWFINRKVEKVIDSYRRYATWTEISLRGFS